MNTRMFSASLILALVVAGCDNSSGSNVPSAGLYAAGIGDIDGDGCADVALTTGFDSSGKHTSTLWFVSGRTGQALRRYVPPAPEFADWFGRTAERSVVRVGDLDHDGRDDFAISIPPSSPTTSSRCRVFVVSGADGRILQRHEQTARFDSLGRGVWAAGDVDHDGTNDVAVETNVPRFGDAAVVVVFSGATGADLLFAPAHVFDDGASSFPDIAPAGDVDGDGRPEFARRFNGRAFIHSARDGHVLRAVASGAETDALFGIGPPPGPSYRLESGDCNDDLVRDSTVLSRREVLVTSGSDAAELFRFPMDSTCECFATHGFAGDVNADGHDDVLVVSTHYLSRQGDHFAPAWGAVTIYSGADGRVLHRFDRQTLFAFEGSSAPCLVLE